MSSQPYVSLATEPALQLAVDALALPVVPSGALEGEGLELDRAAGGLLREVLGSGEHRGHLGELLPLPARGGIAARRLLLYGLGAPEELDGQRLRSAHQAMIREAQERGYRRLAVVRMAPLRAEDLEAVVEGCVLGVFDAGSHRTGARPTPLEGLSLAGFGQGREDEVRRAEQLARATNRAREWQNLPAAEMTPADLASIGHEIARRHDLEVETLGPSELEASGYGLLLGVGAGSPHPPCLLRLRHRTDAGSNRHLALVGKGITFDTGGLSIKTAQGMRGQKKDMSGAAAVLAAMEVIAAWRLPLEVTGLVAAAENVISGTSIHPGDVINSAAGMSVEVVSTDAEGRLVLADALIMAIRHGATHLVDVATLTGSAVQSLGHAITLATANDDGLWTLTRRAAERAGERVWRMPLCADYRPLLRSPIADLKNAFYGEAEAITAALFLSSFVEGRPWVHLDIAGSAWNDNPELTAVPRGPLGTGTRLLVRLAELMAAVDR
ncbi:MAG TPA: leucyl aminopeptidase family protein [Candidatus Dormibacteraeota bacterium]|nr:leucyl aminopeptidase family protein [Candidatus Dormibacteraeota bacterium]